MKTFTASITLAACFFLAPTPAARAADYETGPVWRYWAGDGSSFFGERDYCADSGYPRSTLVLEDVYADEVRALRTGSGDALLLIDGTDDQLLVRMYLEKGEDCAVGAMIIEFADGMTWDTRRQASSNPVPWEGEADRGTRRADRLRGSDNGDALAGAEGNDKLYGYGGGDALWGGPGDDILYGYEGDDVLYGDAGDDDLYGDAGNDIYIFAPGWGDDLIDDDRGDIALSIRWYYSHQIALTRTGNDLVVSVIDPALGQPDRVRLRDYYRRDARITRLSLADVVWGPAEVVAQTR